MRTTVPRASPSAGIRALRRLLEYAGLFVGPADLWRYAGLRLRYARRGASAAAEELRLRSLGGRAVLCRQSQDVWTLRDTFVHRYHLPPEPIAPDGTILDLGANVGYTVAHFAALYPSARVVGVEMDERNLAVARRNTAGLGPRVVLVHAAVWVEDGTIGYAGEGDDAFHIVSATGGRATRQAPSLRLRTLMEHCGIEAAAYVKMDIEGAEAAVLSDAGDWADRVGMLKVEIHPPATLASCAAALMRVGYRCAPDERHVSCLVAQRPGASRWG